MIYNLGKGRKTMMYKIICLSLIFILSCIETSFSQNSDHTLPKNGIYVDIFPSFYTLLTKVNPYWQISYERVLPNQNSLLISYRIFRQGELPMESKNGFGFSLNYGIRLNKEKPEAYFKFPLSRFSTILAPYFEYDRLNFNQLYYYL